LPVSNFVPAWDVAVLKSSRIPFLSKNAAAISVAGRNAFVHNFGVEAAGFGKFKFLRP